MWYGIMIHVAQKVLSVEQMFVIRKLSDCLHKAKYKIEAKWIEMKRKTINKASAKSNTRLTFYAIIMSKCKSSHGIYIHS